MGVGGRVSCVPRLPTLPHKGGGSRSAGPYAPATTFASITGQRRRPRERPRWPSSRRMSGGASAPPRRLRSCGRAILTIRCSGRKFPLPATTIACSVAPGNGSASLSDCCVMFGPRSPGWPDFWNYPDKFPPRREFVKQQRARPPAPQRLRRPPLTPPAGRQAPSGFRPRYRPARTAPPRRARGPSRSAARRARCAARRRRRG